MVFGNVGIHDTAEAVIDQGLLAQRHADASVLSTARDGIGAWPKPHAPEVFVPALAAWPAALRRTARPATLSPKPALN
jgi:hypothetical protein